MKSLANRLFVGLLFVGLLLTNAALLFIYFAPPKDLQVLTVGASIRQTVDYPVFDLERKQVLNLDFAQSSLPLILSGRSPGTWFFEASFPYELFDGNDHLIANGIVEARSDWMTTATIPFVLTLNLEDLPSGEWGTMVVKKDNPSGEARFDANRRIPVRFSGLSGLVRAPIHFISPEAQGAPEFDCTLTESEVHVFRKTDLPKAAIDRLLAGPRDYRLESSLSKDVRLLDNPQIRDGKLILNFSRELNMSGSCRVGAVRAQIEETVRALGYEPVIMVEGSLEEVLEP